MDFRESLPFLLAASLLMRAAFGAVMDCPAFKCTEVDGSYFLGKFVDRVQWTDYQVEEEAKYKRDGIIKRFYWTDEGDFADNFPDVAAKIQQSGNRWTSEIACALKCDGWNSRLAEPDRAGYFLFEKTCDAGESGGACACMNTWACDGQWWSDEWSEAEEYGDYYYGAANYTTGKLCGSHVDHDPHFTGADGSHFDFSGVPNTAYALVSDAHVQVNAFFGGRWAPWGGRTKSLTWMRKIALMWGHHVAVLSVREGPDTQYHTGYMRSIEVDGEPLHVPPHGSMSAADGEFSIAWTGVKEKEGWEWVDEYTVVVGKFLNLRLRLQPDVRPMQTLTDATVHFSLKVDSAVFSSNVHGVVGQTYRPDFVGRLAKQKLVYSKIFHAMAVPGDNAEGFIDGTVEEYEVRDLDKADCTFCRFVRATTIDDETAGAIALESGGGLLAASTSTSSLGRKLMRL